MEETENKTEQNPLSQIPPGRASTDLPEGASNSINPLPVEPITTPEESKPVGRPSIFTQELADKICERIAEGASMRTVCAPDDMPNISTVFRWFRTNDEFCKQYARATEERTEAMSEDILDIADDGSNDLMTIQKGKQTYTIENKEVTNRSRLRVDTRKWLMSKMKPKKYGDKVDLTSGGEAIKTNSIIFTDFNKNTTDGTQTEGQ